MQTRTPRTGRRGAAAATMAAAAVLTPGAASAHLLSTGLGPFYDGLGHFLVTPEDLLPAVALALAAGLAGARLGRVVLFALPTAWLGGALAGLHYGGPGAPVSPALTALVLLGLGALVAGGCRLPLAAGGALAGALGLLHGFGNGTTLAGTGPGLLAVVGIGTALGIVVALTAALVVSLQAAWARIAVRVAGSWIAASGVLMLGWTLSAGI